MTDYPEPVTGGLIQNQDGKIFLMQSPKWDDRWVVPGGHIEPGEDPKTCLKREIQEETGLEIENIQLFTVMTGQPDSFERDTGFVYINYICDAATNKIQLDQREAKNFQWISPQQALDLRLNHSTRRFIQQYRDR